MSRYRKFTTICCAAVFALGLAACGGGGDDGLNTSQEQMLQEQVTTLQGQIAALAATLGVEPNEVGDEIEELQAEVSRLQGLVNAAAKAQQNEAAKAKKAMAAKLYAGLDAAATGAGAALNTATISVTSTGLRADTDDGSADPPAVTLKATDTTVPSYEAWDGIDYVRTVRSPALTDHAVIYSNRDAPKSELFADKYETQLAEDSNAGRLNDTFLTATANMSLIASDDFASGSGFKEHTEANNDVVKIRGSFNGGMGYYHCEQTGGTACRSTVNGTGGITLAGGWSFEPDEGAMAVTPDAAYVLFGWWSREVAAGVDVTTFAQAQGTNPAGAANLALTGTAEYTGGAAGKYSINEPVDGDPNSGAFTARTVLTAKFGNATVGGTISGRLSEFMAGGERKDWTVSLMGFGSDAEAPIRDDGFGTVDAPNTDGSDTARTVWTINGEAGARSGSWSGDFYYESATQQTAANTPPTAAGTFRASHGNVGRMVGAFGAEKK